jgi:hypothetical protein
MPCLCLPFSSPIRSLRPSIPKGAPRASAALPHPPHQRHLLHLSVTSQDSHRRQIRCLPSRRHRYRRMSSHRRRWIPSCCRQIASRHHRILSCRRRIASRRHQVSSSPPPPPLSLRVLGAATIALLRMSRRRDALSRLTALPLRRRLSDALKTMHHVKLYNFITSSGQMKISSGRLDGKHVILQ